MSTQETRLMAIADAIRAKEGSTGAIPAEEFAQRILALETGGPPEGTRTIDLQTNDPGSGAVAGGGVVFDGAVITVKAVPCDGHRFVAWQESGQVVSEELEYTFTADRDMALEGVFEFGRPSRLPKGYKEVEYISNPDYTYIADFGLGANFLSGTRLELDIELLETPVSSHAIIGNRYLYDVATSTSGKFEKRSNLNVLWFKSSTELGLQWGYSNSSTGGYTGKSIPLPSGRMNIVVDYPKSLFSINDVAEQLGSASPSSQSVGAPSLFAYNYSYTQRPSYSLPTSSGNKQGEYPTNFRLHSFKVYASTKEETGELLHDYVPCVTADNVTGLYDLIAQAFFTTPEDGKAFEAGPAIP